MPLHDAPPISQKIIHRLAYRSIPSDDSTVPSTPYPRTKFLDFEMTINEQEGIESAEAEIRNLLDGQSETIWSDGNLVSEASEVDSLLLEADVEIDRAESSQSIPSSMITLGEADMFSRGA